jgi:hypothetical protein
LSAALLLPLGTLSSTFAVNSEATTRKQIVSNIDHIFTNNKKEYYSNAFGDDFYQYVIKPQKQQLDLLWSEKVRFASSIFRKKHPDSSLVEQDYNIIKAINDSLPKQRRITAFEWTMYQRWYLTCNLEFCRAPEAIIKRDAIYDAVYRTQNQYSPEILADNSEFYVKKTTHLANKHDPVSNSMLHSKVAKKTTVTIPKKTVIVPAHQDKKSDADSALKFNLLFFGAIAAFIWWRVKTASERERKNEAYKTEQKKRKDRILMLIDTLPEKELTQRRFELLSGLGYRPFFNEPVDVPDRLLKVLPISVQNTIAAAIERSKDWAKQHIRDSESNMDGA